MTDIDRLIAHKEALIVQLKDEIKALKHARRIVAGVSRPPRATARPGRAMRTAGSKKAGRAPRGARKAQVLGVMTTKPQRMRDIAEKAGLSTQEAASVLQAAVKRGEAKKGRQRGTYVLVRT